MIGPRIGVKASPFTALAVGVGSDEMASQGTVATTTLTLSLADSADPVITAVNFNITADISNVGAATATTLSLAVTLDASLTYVSSSGTGWSFNVAGQIVTCTRATLAVGAAPQIAITVTSGAATVTASTSGQLACSNASTVNDTETTQVDLVSKDATSGMRVPASATEWTKLIAYAGLGISNPNSLWLCQEASGNLADSIGSLTLTAASAPGYQAAATGWTRKGVSFADGAASKFAAAAAVGPNPTTTSSLWIFYTTVTAAPAATRTLVAVGGSTSSLSASAQVTTTPVTRALCVNVPTNGASNPTSAGVMPIGVIYDRTGGRVRAYTLQEKVSGTYNAGVTDGSKGIGATTGQAATSVTVYGFMFSGAAGELSDAQVKSLLQALGWTITWT